MSYKNKSFWLMICAGVGIALWLGSQSFGNSINSAYSSKPASAVGAWYDEVWDAGGYYRLERALGPGGPPSVERFEYRFTTTPNTSPTPPAPPVFRQENASIEQDMVVTEWKVSGHVHFSSGM